MPQTVSDLTRATAVQLLYDNLHALPSEEYGVINLLPFAHDSDQTRTVKRQVCEGIVELFESHNMMNAPPAPLAPPPDQRVKVKCRTCLAELIDVVTADGVSPVDASRFISTVAGLNPDCESQHKAMTLEDLRAHMEREFMAAEQSEEQS